MKSLKKQIDEINSEVNYQKQKIKEKLKNRNRQLKFSDKDNKLNKRTIACINHQEFEKHIVVSYNGFLIFNICLLEMKIF